MTADCLNTITNIFITTFLVAYFFKTADQNVWAISAYFMMFYGAVFFLASVNLNSLSFLSKSSKALLVWKII